jgi:hypothetical protein
MTTISLVTCDGLSTIHRDKPAVVVLNCLKSKHEEGKGNCALWAREIQGFVGGL